MPSLTREAARTRAKVVEVESYHLDLDLRAGDRYFRSTTTVRFRALDPAAETFLDVAAQELTGVRLNGRNLDPGAYDRMARRIPLVGLAASNEVTVDAVMEYSHDGEGLHRHVDAADGRPYLYAMSFLDAAPRWFACFDQPDLKAPVSMTVRCPADWVVSGNGPATRIEAGHWRIAPTGPLATYFTTLVAGPYHCVRDEHDGIPLALLARRSLAEHLERDADELFATTKRCFDELHRLFGRRYPWGEYHQAFVPDFNAGAMENPGCVTLRDALVFRSRATEFDRLNRDITIAHEMAHMWFGDLVTMRWWDDLWLNESFAEYVGQRVIGEHAWVSFGAVRKAWGYAADRRPSTHPVAGTETVDAETALADFDGISYAKGASALRQLAVRLGDETFLGGLRRYVDRHAGGNAEFADLLGAWAASGGRGLDGWARDWLRTTGLDELAVAERAVIRTSATGTPRPHAVAVGVYDSDGTPLALERVQLLDTITRLPAGLPCGVTLPDALDETWAKLVLPESTWAGMGELLPRLADGRTRVALWNALRLAAADAEIDPAAALDVVLAALPAEQDDSILASVGAWTVQTLAGAYLSDAGLPEALRRLSTVLLAVVSAALPGSGRQLAAARLAIATTDDAGLLRDWVAGVRIPEGLAVDTDLRWSLVTRSAALGDVSEAEIDAELERDHSSHGAVPAARCRAARPDPAAKEAAWTTLMTDPDCGNYLLYALADGFWQPEQRAVTAPFVERYFAEIPAASRLRSGWLAGRVAARAYPWTAVDDRTWTATERLLEDDLPPSVHRSVLDAGDDLRRALQVRTKFACI